MTDLFPVETTLSPRLRWMERHGVKTHRSTTCIEEPWTAIRPRDQDKGKDFLDIMAESCRLYDEYIGMGYGQTEDEALVDLCRKLGLKTWVEEAAV